MFTASSASRTCGADTSASLYTATDRTPSSRHARIILTAISPLFATRTLENSRRRSDYAARTFDDCLDTIETASRAASLMRSNWRPEIQSEGVIHGPPHATTFGSFK